MKWIISLLLLIVASGSNAGTTNNTFSQTNIIYMLSTNRLAVSNEVWTAATAYSVSNTTYSVSNLQFLVFSNSYITTNFAVLTPGSNINWMRITNGYVTGITNAAP